MKTRNEVGVVIALVLVIVAAAFMFGLLAGPSGAQGCRTVTGPGDSGVFVNLNNETSSETIVHTKAAIVAGQPRLLHWDPADADAHRRASLRGIPTRPGFDRDEYPPASSLEGGAGADVRYVPSSDNRSAGSRLGRVMSGYCAGQAFIVEP